MKAWSKKYYIYDGSYTLRKTVTNMKAVQDTVKDKPAWYVTFKPIKSGKKKFRIAFSHLTGLLTVDEATRLAERQKYKKLTVPVMEWLAMYFKDAYYNTGNALVEDRHYDALEDKIRKLHPKSKVLVSIGAAVRGRKVALPFHMGSLDKRREDDIDKWRGKGPYLITEKLDGVSLLLVHRNNSTKLYTRGESNFGQDVTHLIPYLKVPKVSRDMMLRGEAIIDKAAFEALNKRVKKKERMANARNYVSGVVNRKTIAKGTRLDFVAFQLFDPVKKPSESIKYMKQNKFDVVWSQETTDASSHNLMALLQERMAKSPYEIDGLVVSSNDKAYRYPSSGNPKYMVAFKSNKLLQHVTVKIKDIIWEESQDLKLTPVIVFKKVQLKDVKVSRATAHNYDFLTRNKIGIGGKVTIVRSGDVIPKVVDVVKPSKNFNLPKGFKRGTGSDEKSIFLTESTPLAQAKAMLFTLTRLGVKTIGIENAKMLVDGGIATVWDILDADRDALVAILKQAKSATIKQQIRKGFETAPLENILAGFHLLKKIGRSKFAVMLEEYPGFVFNKDVFDLSPPHSIGASTWNKVLKKLPEFRQLIEKAGIRKRFESTDEPELESNKLEGRTFCFTGFRDEDMEKWIKANGGKVASSLTSKVTDLVVADRDSGSSKITKAEDRGVNIIEKDNLYSIGD